MLLRWFYWMTYPWCGVDDNEVYDEVAVVDDNDEDDDDYDNDNNVILQ